MTEDWGFLRACDLARTADENFKLAWIEEIEAAWHVLDLDHGAYGFVVVMADGKRQYWRYTSEDTGAGRPEDLVVTDLAAGETPATGPRGAMVPARRPQQAPRRAAARDVGWPPSRPVRKRKT
jgi:hypothetical protein